MPEPTASSPAGVDRSEHLAALHEAWATPLRVVAGVASEVAGCPLRELRRIVAGEQNEVYDVTPERGPALIVKISHRGTAGHEREAWVLAECASREIPAPRLHSLRTVEVGGEQRSVIVIGKLPGELLSDLDPREFDARGVLKELGIWLRALHAIPVAGFGYVDGAGVGFLPTLDDWLAGSITTAAPTFEEAGRSVDVEAATVQSWVREVVDSFESAPPRVGLIHNDLLANHVLVHEGRLSGVIDFGEVAAEPLAVDFARWEFNEGERFPVEWIQSGYGDSSLFEAPNDRVYRALRLAAGLWLMQWYHQTGFLPGVEAARDRMLALG